MVVGDEVVLRRYVGDHGMAVEAHEGVREAMVAAAVRHVVVLLGEVEALEDAEHGGRMEVHGDILEAVEVDDGDLHNRA